MPSGSTAVAEFGASKAAIVNFNTTSTVGALQFDAGAPAYTFNIGSGFALTLAGAGIDNRSTATPVFNVTGRLNFLNSASAANAALVANKGGVIDFSGVTSASAAAGSIGGAGTFALGKNSLTAGSLNSNTTVSGVIQDGGQAGGTGGSLVKAGAGTLTLTGVNTYTGATTVSGILQVSGGGRIQGTSGITLGQKAGDSGTLHVSGAGSSVTTAGSILVGGSGSGTLTIDTGGTVSASGILLGGASGATGTLNIGSGGAAGALNAATVTTTTGATGVVNLNETDSLYTLSSSLRNTLTLNQNGSGTTVLSGTNTYTGGTNLNAGILRVSSNANLGGTAGALSFNGGTLQLSATITNLSRPVTLANGGGAIDTGSFSLTSGGSISGAGGLTKLGSGTLTLSGASTYTGGTTVSGGVLRGTTDSLQGNIVDNGNVTFMQVADGTYAGRMSGTGSLTKLSAGNLTMTGANTYSGATTVSGGTLTVNGSAQSAMSIGMSGTLAGVGTVSGATNVLGTLVAGNSAAPYGTLTLKGNLQMAPGSILLVNTSSTGANSRVNVVGSASMSGSINVLAGSGNYSASTRYTVLSTTNGLTTTGPTPITTDMAFLTPSVSTDANNLYVTLTRNSTSFKSVSKLSNQRATADYLESLAQNADGVPAGSSARVLGLVTQMTAAQARNSFSQLAGSDLTELSMVSRVNTSRVIDMLGDRLTVIATPGTDVHSLDFRANEADLYAQSRGIAFSASEGHSGLWVRSLGTRGSDSSRTATGSDGAPSTVDWYGSGMALGFDKWVSGTALVGVEASYTSSDVDLNSTHSAQGKVRAPQVMFYGSVMQGSLQLRGVAGFGRDFYDTERNLTLGSDTTRSSAVHGANELSGYLEANYTLQAIAGFQFQPVLGLRYLGVDEGAYTESGSDGSLAVAARETNSRASEVGFRISRPLPLVAGAVELRTTWNHEFTADIQQMTAHLAGDESGRAFTVTGASLQQDTLLVGTTVSARLRRNFSANVDYNVRMRAGEGVQQFLSAGFSYAW